MPELPEVETVVRGLRAQVTGRRIVGVRLGKTDFIDDPAALERDLPGARIEEVGRYGKFVLLHLTPGRRFALRHRKLLSEQAAQCEPIRGRGGQVRVAHCKQVRSPTAQAVVGAGRSGRAPRSSGQADSLGSLLDGRRCLVVHLGMTGQLTRQRPEQPVPPHTHVFLALDDGGELRYTDIRRFGRMALVRGEELNGVLGGLGLDPLELSEDEFRARLGERQAMIKALLLDQSVLRGMGNIYCDESLWRARIHPQRHAGRLGAHEVKRLYRAMREVLSAAIRLRGSSVANYVDTAGLPGDYQNRHRVYQREEKGCFRCGKKIRRVIVAGRSSYFCPGCQRAPRLSRRRPRSSRLPRSSPRSSGRAGQVRPRRRGAGKRLLWARR